MGTIFPSADIIMGHLSPSVKGFFAGRSMAISGIWDRISVLQDGKPLAAFCREVGLNYQAIKKGLQRKTSPDTLALEKIARHFRADLRWLITGENASNKLNSKIGKKIKIFRKKKNWSLADLAARLSLEPMVLEHYEKGTWTISPDLLTECAKKLGIPANSLLLEETGPAHPPELKIFQAASTNHAPALRDEDYVSIPLTESSIAAGQPIIQEDSVEDYVLLHIRAAGKKTNLVASRVDGDSMEPMLHSGDIVVIDRDERKIIKNGIYAIFHEEGLTAKYVERQKNLLVLRPVNPNAQVQIVNLNEHPDPVVGRIIGAWKEL